MDLEEISARYRSGRTVGMDADSVQEMAETIRELVAAYKKLEVEHKWLLDVFGKFSNLAQLMIRDR